MSNRKNPKQLHVEDDIYSAAAIAQRRYSFAFGRDISWRAFGNILLQRGTEAIEKEIEDVIASDEKCLRPAKSQ